jgi:hypothetical protein
MKILGPPTASEQSVIKHLQGRHLHDGQITLLTAPKWQNDKWEALANVAGYLCIIEVSLRIDLAPTDPQPERE